VCEQCFGCSGQGTGFLRCVQKTLGQLGVSLYVYMFSGMYARVFEHVYICRYFNGMFVCINACMDIFSTVAKVLGSFVYEGMYTYVCICIYPSHNT
jgi:hypothetical protein